MKIALLDNTLYNTLCVCVCVCVCHVWIKLRVREQMCLIHTCLGILR